MINALLINGAPINAGSMGGGGSAVVVEPRVSILWRARVMLDGVDVSDLLIGNIRVEEERGAASLADCAILLDPGPVNPLSYTGKPLTIHYVEWRAGAWVEYLLFSGWVIRPSFEPVDRTVAFECSDRIQDAVEALSVAQVDALAGGYWSEDLFEAPEGRSRWDYLQERLSTRAASLNRTAAGALVVTPWAATAPAFVFGEGVTMDRSLGWSPVDLSDRVNVVELEALQRFPRLRERHQPFAWEHPAVEGLSDIDGFCFWHTQTTELPDIPMIEEGSEGAGYQAILNANWRRLPLTELGGQNAGSYCDPQFAWVNNYPDLLLGGEWTSARRWVQPVTELYRIRVEAPQSVADAGEVIRRDRVAVDSSDNDRADTWGEEAWTAPAADATQDALGDWVVDLREAARWQQALTCAVAIQRVQILAAHRGNRLSWQVPTSDAMGVTLAHTLRVEDQGVICEAPVWMLVHELSIDEQTALTTVVQGVSQGGGTINDPITVPPAPPSTPAGEVPLLIQLPTQLGGQAESPPYDDELLGFSGNYPTILEPYPRRFDVPIAEIPADHQDEYEAEATVTYRVAVPNDLLEFV
jgi:hypothetical protein